MTAKALKAWPQLLNAVGRTISELDLSPSSKRLHLALEEPFDLFAHRVRCLLARAARDAGAHIIPEKISARKAKQTRVGA